MKGEAIDGGEGVNKGSGDKDFTERPARQNLTGRWIARDQHDDLGRGCTYHLGGGCHFFFTKFSLKEPAFLTFLLVVIHDGAKEASLSCKEANQIGYATGIGLGFHLLEKPSDIVNRKPVSLGIVLGRGT